MSISHSCTFSLKRCMGCLYLQLMQVAGFFTARNSTCGKVMFSQVSANLFTEGRVVGPYRIPGTIPPPPEPCLPSPTVGRRVVRILLESCLVVSIVITWFIVTGLIERPSIASQWTIGSYRVVNMATMALSSMYSIGTRACVFTMVQKLLLLSATVKWTTLWGQDYIQRAQDGLHLGTGMASEGLSGLHTYSWVRAAEPWL